MTRKKRRLYMLGLALLGLGTATALAFTAFEDNLVFFYSPSDLAAQHVGERSFRFGGLVEENSVKRLPDGLTIEFRVTDTAQCRAGDLFRHRPGSVPRGSGRGTKAGTRRRLRRPPRCWPSTTRTTCRPKSPTRSTAAPGARGDRCRRAGKGVSAAGSPEIGHYALVLALFLALVQSVVPLVGARAATRPGWTWRSRAAGQLLIRPPSALTYAAWCRTSAC